MLPIRIKVKVANFFISYFLSLEDYGRIEHETSYLVNFRDSERSFKVSRYIVNEKQEGRGDRISVSWFLFFLLGSDYLLFFKIKFLGLRKNEL